MIPALKEGRTADIIFGIAAPTLVAFLIIGVSILPGTAFEVLKYPLLEAIVIVGVPMLIGLVWNQWAGGSAGFLLGSLYTLYFSDQLYAYQGRADISLLGNLVSAMLIGYISGALSKRSDNYRRMLFAGVTAGVMSSLLLVFVSQYSSIVDVTASGTALIFLSRISAGILVPLIARAFLRHNKTQTNPQQSLSYY